MNSGMPRALRSKRYLYLHLATLRTLSSPLRRSQTCGGGSGKMSRQPYSSKLVAVELVRFSETSEPSSQLFDT
jgi:hypothetical protein